MTALVHELFLLFDFGTDKLTSYIMVKDYLLSTDLKLIELDDLLEHEFFWELLVVNAIFTTPFSFFIV